MLAVAIIVYWEEYEEEGWGQRLLLNQMITVLVIIVYSIMPIVDKVQTTVIHQLE